MSDDKNERWQRDHQRKLITVLRESWPAAAGAVAERQIHRLLGRMNDPADPAGPVDVSDHELAVLACLESPDAVRVALAALVAGGHLSVESGPEGVPLGVQQFMWCKCPVCHEMLAAIHRRALEQCFTDHMAEKHGLGFSLERGRILH